MANKHKYKTGTYGNIKLHVIETDASNIKLVNLAGGKSIGGSTYFGVNGGWFDLQKGLLNVTVCDGYVVADSGSNNNGVGGGVIGWDGSQALCLTGTNNIDAIRGAVMGVAKNGTWAQGGFSLWLGDSQWKTKLDKEVNGDDQVNIVYSSHPGRTALVAKNGGDVRLFVTRETVGVEKFRDAIQAYLGIKNGTATEWKGILLDGSYSSQLKAKNDSNATVTIEDPDKSWGTSYPRRIYGIVALRDNS